MYIYIYARYMARAWERRVICIYTNTLFIFLHTHTHSTVYTSFGARPEMWSNMHLYMYNLLSHIHTHLPQKHSTVYMSFGARQAT